MGYPSPQWFSTYVTLSALSRMIYQWFSCHVHKPPSFRVFSLQRVWIWYEYIERFSQLLLAVCPSCKKNTRLLTNKSLVCISHVLCTNGMIFRFPECRHQYNSELIMCFSDLLTGKRCPNFDHIFPNCLQSISSHVRWWLIDQFPHKE